MPLQNLVLFGTLFLSPQEVSEQKISSSHLWFSKPDIVQASLIGSSKVLLKAQKTGSVFVSGLSQKGLQKIVVLSPANFNALRKCGSSKLLLESEILELGEDSQISEENLSHLKLCGFEEIALPSSLQLKLNSQFMSLESSLLKQGFRILQSHWNSQKQRVLKVAISDLQKDKSKILSTLGNLKSFYKLECKEGAKPGRSLSFETTLFEFSKSRAQQLGIHYPESLRIIQLEKGSGADENSGSWVGLDFGEKEGIGKVIARPKMRTQPGEKAIFQSGGEIPVKNENLHSSTTSWKSYGLQIEIEPDASLEIGSQEISLRFKVEISEPDFANSVAGVPSFRTRKLENRFDLRVNETTILTSLVQLRKGLFSNGVAGLRQIPIFGSLFESQNRFDSESELYFALYPTWNEIL